MQILQEMSNILNIKDVGVVLRANHSCISCRGVKHLGSNTITSVFRGKIKKNTNLITLLLG